MIVVVALPFFSMRLGLADSGEDPSGSTTKQAYDLLAQGFGPGSTAPSSWSARSTGRRPRPIRQLRHGTRADTRCRPCADATCTSPNGKAARRIRLPGLQPTGCADDESGEPHSRRSAKRHRRLVTGHPRRGSDRRPASTSQRSWPRSLPVFVTVIVVLAFLLLATVFRSLLVPLTASIMNILSIGAAPGSDHRRVPVRLVPARSRLLESRSDRGVPAGA